MTRKWSSMKMTFKIADGRTTILAKITFLWTVYVFCLLQFLSGAFAIPREVRGRTFDHWGFPTCPEAMDFAAMGFTKVQEAMLMTGTITCPEDWKQEYPGYLVTWRDDVGPTELECVNITQMATIRSSQYIQGQTLIFYTNSACGHLPWPPYQEDGVVMCAVCSRVDSNLEN